MSKTNKSLILNVAYVFASSLNTYSSWVYKGTPSIQLLLQSVFKIALVTAISKIQTGAVPKIIFFDKFLIISALLFSCSSFCTFKIWYVYEMSPFVYSMGTTPSLLFVDILQNGWSFHKLSTLTLLAWFIVPGHIVPAFLVKCTLASFASYTSSIGLGFAQSGDLQERSSKVVSFSIISALIPLPWISDRGTPKNQLYEYVQAFIGAVSGLMTAFVLSYNGTVAKVGISSVKDFIFLFLQKQYLTVWSVVFMIGKCVVSTVSLRPVLQKSSTTELENPSENIIQSV